MGFKVNYDPYQQYSRWDELNQMFHGALGAQASLLPFGGREWGIDQGMLANSGAPDAVVQAAQAPQGRGYTPASTFLERLQQLFGQQIRQNHPGIENIDLNGLMGKNLALLQGLESDAKRQQLKQAAFTPGANAQDLLDQYGPDAYDYIQRYFAGKRY